MPPNVTRACILVFSLAALSGCASAFRHSNGMVPGPSGAVAAVPLSHGRVAVLAGSDDAKAVFVIDLDSGRIKQSFGVTREATGLAAETPEGPVLVSVGGHTPDGKSVGSVERWSLTGEKQQVVPMPAPALGLTQAVDGTLFVLVGDDKAKAAIALSTPALGVGTTVPLDADDSYIALCRVGANAMLVYSGEHSPITARIMDSGQLIHSAIVGASPTCIEGDPRIYAISKGFTSRSVVVLTVPDMAQVAAIPASSDVRTLYPGEDRTLLALNASSSASNIQQFGHDKLSQANEAAPH